MRSSPLQLEDYFMTELHFKVKQEYDFSSEEDLVKISPSDLHISINRGKQQDNDLKRICYITVKQKEPAQEQFPWVFIISLVGFFEVVEGYPAEWVEDLVNANAPAILYSAAREKLATVSSRSPYPEIILPSVTFIESKFETESENQKQNPAENEKLKRQLAATVKKSAAKTTRKTTKK